MTTERIKSFIDSLNDEETATAIAISRQSLQTRFDERRKALDSDYKRLLKEADSGKALKAAKESKNAAAA